MFVVFVRSVEKHYVDNELLCVQLESITLVKLQGNFELIQVEVDLYFGDAAHLLGVLCRHLLLNFKLLLYLILEFLDSCLRHQWFI